MSERHRDLENMVLSELSVDNALGHVNWLYENVGERLAGTEKEREAAEYFKGCLEGYGLAVSMQEFPTYVGFPSEASVTVVAGGQKEVFGGKAYAFSASTPENGSEAELVYVGEGGESDYEGVDVAGKFVMARFSWNPVYNEKVRIAERHGAKGFIIMNWTEPEKRAFHYGAVKHVWGTPTYSAWTDPTPESFAKVPVLCLVRADGEKILDMLKGSPAIAKVNAQTVREWRNVVQPVASIEGTGAPEQFVLVGGHYDAYGGASTCNGSGNALMLELARVLSEFRGQMKRSVRLAWWTGHETPKQAGSAHYVDTMWDDLSENCIAYYNCDSPGMTGATGYDLYGFSEINRFHENVVSNVIGIRAKSKRPPKWGDQSFWGIGIPTIDGRNAFPPGYQWGVLGWWYHSADDTPDKVDPDGLLKALRVYAATVIRLCNATILPFNFVDLADELLTSLWSLYHQSPIENPGVKRMLEGLLERAYGFKAAARELNDLVQRAQHDQCEDRARDINRVLMRLSRILSVANYGLSERYYQDRWGEAACRFPFARIQTAALLKDLPAGSRHAMEAQLLKERNRVSDSLAEATSLLRKLLADNH